MGLPGIQVFTKVISSGSENHRIPTPSGLLPQILSMAGHGNHSSGHEQMDRRIMTDTGRRTDQGSPQEELRDNKLGEDTGATVDRHHTGVTVDRHHTGACRRCFRHRKTRRTKISLTEAESPGVHQGARVCRSCNVLMEGHLNGKASSLTSARWVDSYTGTRKRSVTIC